MIVLAGTSCKQWDWMLNGQARKFTFDVPAGSMFSTDNCGLQYEAVGHCYS